MKKKIMSKPRACTSIITSLQLKEKNCLVRTKSKRIKLYIFLLSLVYFFFGRDDKIHQSSLVKIGLGSRLIDA
jgi:hypothetical protein